MFGFISKSLKSFCSGIANKLNKLFKSGEIDQGTINEVEKILLSSDAGPVVTKNILDKLNQDFIDEKIKNGEELRLILEEYLLELMIDSEISLNNKIYLMTGINGSGKTTLIGKLAQSFTKNNKKVLLVAADTFRSAAVQQLESLVSPIGVKVVSGPPESSPASVVFKGCEEFKQNNYDILLIDTAGRLQSKTSLMQELAKIKKVINKQLPEEDIATLLTVDAILGQNSIEQVKIFSEYINLDAIVLTKMDSASKGGTALAIVDQFKLPIAYISFGEDLESIKEFNKKEYVSALLAE